VGECPVDDAISVVKDREGLAGKDQSIGGTRVAGVAGADGSYISKSVEIQFVL